MSKAIDLTGKRVGRLTVIGQAPRKNGRIAWKCKCDCGNEVVILTTSLATERTKSCGCYQQKRVSETFKKHGLFGSRLYRIWSNMNQRCNNPQNTYYALYGGQGVTVCDEWRKFEPFSQWAIKSGYFDTLSIDRIDNNKGYSPDNCKWSTPQEQTDNRRCTKYVVFNGERRTLASLAKETGVSYSKLLWRVNHGWPIEKAVMPIIFETNESED